MAVIEIYTSREMHITKEGTTITQIFSCSNTDWNAGGDGTTTLPIIGEKWSDARPDLCVTDIHNRWRSNLECIVEVTYSRGGFNYPHSLPDTRSSLEETFDFSFQPIQLIDEDPFWDFVSVDSDTGTAGTETAWKTHYRITYPSKGIEPNPVPEPAPHIVWTIKMNVSTWSWVTIKNALGKVNDVDFLKQYRVTKSRPPAWEDETENDSGFWLFVGFNAVQIGSGNIQVTYIFLHSGVRKWNEPWGVTDMNMYQKMNFWDLPFPEGEDDTVDEGLR